ncbi:NUDIX hydrolase [Actinomadura sp. 7K507]|uniref:NUDIX hydrolase n=1 Tax=Actinomadura sp. 7K507 TaxID=2530365 RepID=UPI001049D77B|nr:NUDIX hydrolase [Actinomadura sp. 7K507]TDC73819.1 NUDIX hydrolase [Actinomadura sp. 7K507]
MLDSEMALDETWCKIRRETVRLPDGSVLNDYFLAVRPEVAVVFAVSDARRVPLVRQYKHGAGAVTLELPAGTFTTERAEDAGLRELREETGWWSDDVVSIGEFFDDASKNTNRVHCVVALHAAPRLAQDLDDTERAAGLEVVEADLDKIPALLAEGTIKAQSSVACAYRSLAWLREKGLADELPHPPRPHDS